MTLGIRRYQDVGAFHAHMDCLARDATGAGSSLLLLPELACLGLLWGDSAAGETTAAGVATLYRRRLTPLLDANRFCLSELARSRQITIAGASCWHQENGRGLNSGFVVFPDGRMLRQGVGMNGLARHLL